MMIGALCGLILAAGIEIAVAPDQPIPLVYADEPLIIELRPSENQSARVRIEATDSIGGGVQEQAAGPLKLIKDTPYWLPIDDFPLGRGHYRIAVYLEGEESSLLGEGFVARVDRHPERPTSRIQLNVEDGGPWSSAVARAAGVGRLSAGAAQVHRFAEEGFRVEGRIAEGGPYRVAPEAADWVALGAADPEGLPEALATVESSGGSRIPWVQLTCTDDLDSAAAVITSAAPRWRVAHVDPLTMVYLESLRARAEGLGWERPTWSAAIAHDEPAAWLQGMIRAWAFGCESVEISVESIWDGEAFLPPFVYCVALAHLGDRLIECIGSPDVGEGVEAYLFDTDDGWCVVAWSTEGASAEAKLSPADVTVRGASGEALSSTTDDEGNRLVPVTSSPVFIFGDDPVMRARAAAAAAVGEAKRLLATDGVDELLPDTTVRGITVVDSDDGPVMPRREFLLMLQTFASLEAQITRGDATEERVVPVMASLTRLIRALCVLDQDREEIFLTPHLTRLDRLQTFQAQYLTSSDGDERDRRGAALNEEVRRLSALVRQVAARGYGIEADGLAALAEWRARSLELTGR